MRATQDDRGRSFWDIVPELPGQINVSITKPLQKRGFHMHKKKTDYWFCAKGRLLVVTFDSKPYSGRSDFQEIVLSEGEYMVIVPGIWHAYQNINKDESILVYYETNKSGASRDDDLETPLESYKGWLK